MHAFLMAYIISPGFRRLDGSENFFALALCHFQRFQAVPVLISGKALFGQGEICTEGSGVCSSWTCPLPLAGCLRASSLSPVSRACACS